MGNADVSETVGKWKHGLKLITCPVCINEKLIPYNCHQCNDMGEYWVMPHRGGKKVIEVGKLEQALISRRIEEAYEEGLTG